LSVDFKGRCLKEAV